LNNAFGALSLHCETIADMKWLIRNKDTGLYLKNVWNWTNKVSEAFVFPNGLSLVEFCIHHQIPPMDMIPVNECATECARQY